MVATFSTHGLARQVCHLAFATAVVAGLLATQPAQAQVFYGSPVLGPPVLSGRAIVGALQSEGFRRLSPPVLNRDVYLVDAIDPYGDPVRVIVSAFNGQIVAAHPQRGAFERRDSRHGAGRWGGLPQVDPFDDDDEDVLRTAPRSVPQRPPRQASAPPVRIEPPKASNPTAVNPALTPKNPTVVKTSPLAIPKGKDAKDKDAKDKDAKDKDAKDKDSKAPPVAAVPGTRVQPRVIPIAPATVFPAGPNKAGETPRTTEPAKATESAKAAGSAKASEPVKSPSSAFPPPAVLDDGGLSKRPVTPQVPPALLD